MSDDRVQVKKIYGEVITELGEQNPDIFVIEADLMKASGTAPFKNRFPDRHINVGIAEQNLIGVAAGIASTGRVPFACTMANFMAKRASDQVAMSVAYNNFNVKLVGCYAGLTQEKNGGTHISFMDIGVMRSIPRLTVVVPSDVQEFAQAVKAIAEYDGPVYVRMAKLLPPAIFDREHTFTIGKIYQFGDGKDLTLVSTGLTTEIALDARKELEKEGIRVRVLHVPTLKPIDKEPIIKSARETGAILTIEDHSVYSGLGGLLSELVTTYHPVPIKRLGYKDEFGLTAPLDYQLEYFGLTVKQVKNSSKELLKVK